MRIKTKGIIILLAANFMFSTLTVNATESDNISAGNEYSIEGASSFDVLVENSTEETSEEVYAESTVKDVEEAANGVLQINCVYIDDDGNSHLIKGGTGFLVGGTEENSQQYLITSTQAIIPDKETKRAALKSFGVKKDEIDQRLDKIAYEVVVVKEMTISASLYQKSDELNLAVFSLGEKLSNRTALSIYTSDDGYVKDLPYKKTGTVYSIGFPDSIAYNNNPTYYNKDDIVLSAGKIVNIHSLNDNFIITHDAEVGPNNCGGPLVDEAGNVIGMNVLMKDGIYSVAIDSTELVNVLDSFGIEYNKLTPSSMKPEEEAVAGESATTASSDSSVSSQTENTYRPPVMMIIIIAGIIVLLITALIVVIFLLYKNKNNSATDGAQPKKEKKKKKEEPALTRPFAMTNTNSGNMNQSGGTGMGTSVLGAQDSGAKGTTVLGGNSPISQAANAVNGGTLIRKKTKDNIILCKPETKIGKDSLHVDYCIRDNSTISRIHAVFKVTPQGASVEDCNSTNGTFVNGVRLNANEAKFLNKGDVIRLANEEFDYRK